MQRQSNVCSPTCSGCGISVNCKGPDGAAQEDKTQAPAPCGRCIAAFCDCQILGLYRVILITMVACQLCASLLQHGKRDVLRPLRGIFQQQKALLLPTLQTPRDTVFCSICAAYRA